MRGLSRERGQAVRLHPAARRRELGGRRADRERDVVEAGHALGLRPGPLGARELARDVMVVDARGEEDDASALAGARLREAEDVAIEAARGVEVTDEERDVTELADRGPRECVHRDE